MQTEEPFWLAESYANPMTSYDLGGVSRPRLNTRVTRAVLVGCFDPAARCLDFGGGYGVFTRWMRDLGFDFWHYDKHCANLFANGFEGEMSGQTRYELTTAFEVFEHFPQPIPMLEAIFEVSDSILFTTDLVPEPTPALTDWWYFGPEHGQHVAFYTAAALHKLAARFGASYINSHRGFHLITRRKIAAWRFRAVLDRWPQLILNYMFRRPSLLEQDFYAAMARAKRAAASTAQ